jgi:short-subunit dehydrogenase
MSRPICAIVGAGEGLGRSLAAKFAGEGFDIGLISRSEEAKPVRHIYVDYMAKWYEITDDLPVFNKEPTS